MNAEFIVFLVKLFVSFVLALLMVGIFTLGSAMYEDNRNFNEMAEYQAYKDCPHCTVLQ